MWSLLQKAYKLNKFHWWLHLQQITAKIPRDRYTMELLSPSVEARAEVSSCEAAGWPFIPVKEMANCWLYNYGVNRQREGGLIPNAIIHLSECLLEKPSGLKIN